MIAFEKNFDICRPYLLLPVACRSAGDAERHRSTAQAAHSRTRYWWRKRCGDLKRVPELPATSSPAEWQKEAERLREHELSVIYHGWPREWVEAKPKFEKVAEITRRVIASSSFVMRSFRVYLHGAAV